MEAGRSILIVVLFVVLMVILKNTAFAKNCCSKDEIKVNQWSQEKAQQWYAKQQWLVGCNFSPSTAINQLEMWQEESFDPKTIDRELKWASDIGFNVVRVYLHDLPWQHDRDGFIKRIDKFLAIADTHKIKVVPVLLDSCWNPFPKLGKQPEPTPYVHNSGWVQSPSIDVFKDPNRHDELKSYITGILTHYKTDRRILFWDMYNETGNTNDAAYGKYEPANKSDLAMTLLGKVWKWARQVNPEQPITVCVWRGEWAKDGVISDLDRFALENSDIITFHNYADANSVSDKIKALRQYGRPIVCTEYMSRSTGSTFQNILPILKKNCIGAINWGFVAGKTQTNYPWDSWNKKYTAEPDLWFHDIFRTDGTPYSAEEVKFIRDITKDCNMPADGQTINKPENKIASPAVAKKPFGKTPDGQQVDVYTLTNKNGVRAEIMNYGAALISLIVPDCNGQFADIVPGYDSFEGYLKSNPYFGGIVGRFGNRIAKGKFTLDGVEYTLATNNNVNHLHGGKVGFDRVIWNARSFEKGDLVGVKLDYLSKDGEEGYPGNLNVTVTYTLTNNNELMIDYDMTTDKATPVNLTQHGYWNLAGAGNGDILSHLMTINADRFTPTDETSIPTGELRSVKGTPMDFTKPTAIGDRVNDADDQLKYGKGYDHNWALNKTDNSTTFACRVYDPNSGRMMEIYTTEPGLQFYSGNFLDGTIIGKGGKKYDYRSAIVLETQRFPDSPNHANFPSTILRPGQKYESHTIYKFSIKN